MDQGISVVPVRFYSSSGCLSVWFLFSQSTNLKSCFGKAKSVPKLFDQLGGFPLTTTSCCSHSWRTCYHHMRVPGDHTPVSQGTAECNHPLWCPPMYRHIHGVCTCEHRGWAGATTLECDVGAPVTPPHPPEKGGGPPSRSSSCNTFGWFTVHSSLL